MRASAVTHGDVLNVHTGVFQRATTARTHQDHNDMDTTQQRHTTSHGEGEREAESLGWFMIGFPLSEFRPKFCVPSPLLLDAVEETGGVVARGSRCQHRSFVGTSLLVETVLESGSAHCHAQNVPGSRRQGREQDCERVRRRSYLEVFYTTESGQQNAADMIGAGVGASGAGNGDCGRRRLKKGQTSHGEDPGSFDQVGLWRRHEGSAGQVQPRDVEGKEASEPQHDIEGKAAWVLREARRLNELEADIAIAGPGRYKNSMCKGHSWATGTGCVGAGDQGNGPLMQELEKRELLILRELVAATVPSNLSS